MVSVLRTLQAEWNALVPQAERLGIRRVRTLNLPLETIEYRRTKLEWLRGEIARLNQTTSLTPARELDLSVFTYGIEIEFIIGDILGTGDRGRENLARRINDAGVSCRSEGYNHNVSQSWKLTTDGSVDGSYVRGFELVSPVLRGEDGFVQVKKICEVLKATGCKVNKKCGLHVHVGAGDWHLNTFKNLVRLYGSAEKAIDSFMSPSRRESNNSYTKAIRIRPTMLEAARSVDEIAVAIFQSPGRLNVRGTGRYCKVNLQSYWQHGTVEFRHHQGTVEADKIINWTRLCLRMCLAARDGVHSATSFEALFNAVKSPAAERAFFQGRADFFANQLARAIQRANPSAVRQARTEFGAGPNTNNVFEEAAAGLSRRATTRDQF